VPVGPGSLRPLRPSPQPPTHPGPATKKGAPNPLSACMVCSERCGEPWTARYEDLRRQELELGIVSHVVGWGRALVIRQGLVAWMDAWPRQQVGALPTPGATRSTIPTGTGAAVLPAGLRPQAIHILVNMVLARRPEVLA
jgi:hypothetical protein